MNRIKQAVNENDWDLVIELAEKAKKHKSDEQAKKIKDALADPAEISIVTKGRNGQTVTYEFPVEKHEKAKIDYTYDRDVDYDQWIDYGPVIRSSQRRVKIGISIVPASDYFI